MSLAGCALTLALALVSARDAGHGRAGGKARAHHPSVHTAQGSGGKGAGATKRKRAPAATGSVTGSPAASLAAERQLPAPPPPPARSETTAAVAAGGGDDDAPGKGEGAGTTAKVAKTKVYTFGAMDVEGKLKTPQLLYFLNRVKLELEMSAPDHRSFIKELEKSADDPNL